MLRRRLAAAGSLAAVCVGVGVAGHLLSSDRPGNHAAITAAGPQPVDPTRAQRVFYVDGDQLSSARLDGRGNGPASAPLFSAVPADTGWASPDGHWLLLADGELIDLTADRPLPAAQAVPPELVVGPGRDLSAAGPVELATSEPWADFSSRLVVAYGGRLSSVELATGASVTMGTGQLPAGDPVSNGAAYVVSGGLLPPSVARLFGGSAAAVARIERVSAGRPAQTLASGSQLAAVLGGSAGATVVAGQLAFSPDGSRLAVAVAGLGGTQRTGGVVVLNRGGGVLDVASTPFSAGRTWLAWSPAGNRLAFGIPLPTTPQLAAGAEFLEPQLWHPGTDTAHPAAGAGGEAPADPCLWSPDGAALLCGDGGQWSIVELDGSPQTTVTDAPGQPLAWVGGVPGSRHG